MVPALVAGALLFAGCSGSDDSSTDTVPVVDSTPVETPSTLAAPVTTAAPTTTTLAVVTEGATVVVANGNIVGGSAGRMTDALAAQGYTLGTAVDGTEKVEASIVYHVDEPAAEAVATSLAAQLGGVDVEVLPETPPIEGELAGEVLLLLGNLQADKSIAELSGGAESAAEDVQQVVNAGSVVVVANGSGIGGSAGAMTTQLEAAGFTVGTPTNSTAQASESVVYYDAAAADAAAVLADAEAVALALGGITVLELPDDVPTDSGSLDGDILVVLGTAEAGSTLAELAG